MLFVGDCMRTELLNGESILKRMEGSIYVGGGCSSGECYLTDRRLIFEESDRKTPSKTTIPDMKKLAKDAAKGYFLLGGLGALKETAKNVETEPGQVVPGRDISAWFEEVADLKVKDSTVEVTIRKDRSRAESVRFEAAPRAGKFTLSEQEKLKELLESSKLKARTPEEQSLDLEAKLSLLIEVNAKKGFLKPEQKVEYDISRKMNLGKTREEAIKELYEET
jgi:hypothetical protein